ncbi:C-C motif chemokine 21-like [Pogoniulus pusillus]|uniref:C-C motif chemokine 21-like n=1 Tax=Pogoniulus pusillus TaxID=488313 RepID=UPI0030B93B2E
MALRLLLLLLMLAAALLINQSQGISSSASDCCLKYSQKGIPRGLVKSYSIQELASGCAIPAIVFITKKGKKICASPTEPSVQKLIKNIEKKVKGDIKDRKKGQHLRSRGRSKRQKRQ